MMIRSIQFFFLILGNSFASEDCGGSSWRCGDACIDERAVCKCGDDIFGYKDQKWCCNNNICDNGECTERALNLTDQKCNYYEDPEIISVVNSDGDGNVRDYIPCNVTHVKTKMRTR